MMEWAQFIILTVTVAGLFFWNRSESRSDYRHSNNLIRAIHEEMKDFHGRLCAIEERNKSNNQQAKEIKVIINRRNPQRKENNMDNEDEDELDAKHDAFEKASIARLQNISLGGNNARTMDDRGSRT